MERPFRSGDIIYKKVETPRGAVEMLAEAIIEGDALHLKDIAIYPSGVERIDLGAASMLSIARRLFEEARALGFAKLRITGVRHSGTSPGRPVDIMLDLSR